MAHPVKEIPKTMNSSGFYIIAFHPCLEGVNNNLLEAIVDNQGLVVRVILNAMFSRQSFGLRDSPSQS